MKSTINIIPEQTASLHITAEIGWHGATIIWKNSKQQIEGVCNYVFEETEINKIKQLGEVLQTFSSYENDKNLFYNFSEFVLIPKPFYSEHNASSILDVQYPITQNDIVLTDSSQNIMNVYAVPKLLHEIILQKNIPFLHSASCQLNIEDGILAIFYENSVKLILHQYGKLQFNQQFSFQNPPEAAYHILNVCRQHELDVEEETVRIAGMVDEQSPLYNEISKFFNVSFAVTEQITKAATISAYPDHFFYHLMALSACVS